MPDNEQALAPFDLTAVNVQLDAAGRMTPHAGGASFWAQPAAALDAIGTDWLVSTFDCDADWPQWERHPDADEFVCLLGGEATLRLALPGGERSVPLHPQQAIVVPRGVWHTARILAPSRMLFVTLGRGT
jgi:mannose-6-phosphate isomerase-like protein (cupin superfamily)